eukprot:scaffold2229_cov262-Pinguiococcus_pyrenoidosus.AAC.12
MRGGVRTQQACFAMETNGNHCLYCSQYRCSQYFFIFSVIPGARLRRPTALSRPARRLVAIMLMSSRGDSSVQSWTDCPL